MTIHCIDIFGLSRNVWKLSDDISKITIVTRAADSRSSRKLHSDKSVCQILLRTYGKRERDWIGSERETLLLMKFWVMLLPPNVKFLLSNATAVRCSDGAGLYTGLWTLSKAIVFGCPVGLHIFILLACGNRSLL